MLELHHLQRSQSERVLWLCEELGIDYELHVHERNQDTALAPQIFKDLHTPGTAPVILDATPSGKRVVIGESGACVEYIANVYGAGRFTVKPTAENYSDYLSWYHFSNGSLQAGNSRVMAVDFATGGQDTGNPVVNMMAGRQDTYRQMIDKRLGESPFLGGDELTLADIMTVYSLTTNRGFTPGDLSPYKNILKYLEKISKREGYLRAREKGEPDEPPLIGPTSEHFKIGPWK